MKSIFFQNFMNKVELNNKKMNSNDSSFVLLYIFVGFFILYAIIILFTWTTKTEKISTKSFYLQIYGDNWQLKQNLPRQQIYAPKPSFFLTAMVFTMFLLGMNETAQKHRRLPGWCGRSDRGQFTWAARECRPTPNTTTKAAKQRVVF